MITTDEVYTVAILEDEPAQSEMLKSWLESEGIQVLVSESADTFLNTIKSETVDLVILDWLLPDSSGLEVVACLRDKLNFLGPVLFATQLDSEQHVVSALNAGADDYLIKPLRQKEFIARVSALRRRSVYAGAPLPLLKVGPIQVDILSRSVFVNGEPVKLTPKEFELAACVLARKGQLLTREYLLNKVWGVEAEIDTRTVDMHMSRIRRALKISPEMGYCIKTIYQHGYRLENIIE